MKCSINIARENLQVDCQYELCSEDFEAVTTK